MFLPCCVSGWTFWAMRHAPVWITHELWMCASKLVCKSIVYLLDRLTPGNKIQQEASYNHFISFHYPFFSFFWGFTSSYTMEPMVGTSLLHGGLHYIPCCTMLYHCRWLLLMCLSAFSFLTGWSRMWRQPSWRRKSRRTGPCDRPTGSWCRTKCPLSGSRDKAEAVGSAGSGGGCCLVDWRLRYWHCQ